MGSQKKAQCLQKIVTVTKTLFLQTLGGNFLKNEINRATGAALPDDGVNVINPEVMKEMDEYQTTDEGRDSENEFADFCAELFGQNTAAESTYL